MKKISQRKVTNDFIHALFEMSAQDWNYNLNSINIKKIIKYFSDLSRRDFKKLLSDPVWNNYRGHKYDAVAVTTPMTNAKKIYLDKIKSEEYSQDRYGYIITRAIRKILIYDKDLGVFMAKNSVGLILNTIIRNSSGEVFIEACKSGYKSSDFRVRNTIARVCPINILHKMQKDSVASVRLSVINRLGINNCYKDYLNDPCKRIRTMAIAAAQIDEIDLEGIMSNISSKIANNNACWLDKYVARNIISKLDPKDAVYYINLSSNDAGINEILKYKLD